MTNQDHNTPAEPDERLPVGTKSAATGEPGSAADPVGTGGTDSEATDGGGEADLSSGVPAPEDSDPAAEDHGPAAADYRAAALDHDPAAVAGTPGVADAVPAANGPHAADPHAADPHAADPEPDAVRSGADVTDAAPGAAGSTADVTETDADDAAPDSGAPVAPYPALPQAASYPAPPPQAGGPPMSPLPGAPLPAGQEAQPGYPVSPQYGYGGQPAYGEHTHVPRHEGGPEGEQPQFQPGEQAGHGGYDQGHGREAQAYQPPYYGYGQPYADPGMPYGDGGNSYSPGGYPSAGAQVPGGPYSAANQAGAGSTGSAAEAGSPQQPPGNAPSGAEPPPAPESYAGPESYGSPGSYAGPDSYGSPEPYPAAERGSGWDYADPGRYPAPPPYGAAAYPESPPRPEPPPLGMPSGYPGGQPPPNLAYGDPGTYPNMPPGPGRSQAEALAPLPPRRVEEQARETADSLTPESLLPTKKPPPTAGWRRAIFRATGGLIKPGESQAELRRRDLVFRARTPVAGGHHRVAVMSLKGGVGKTTTAVALGSMLASLRGDRVIAVDANPDRGTLSDKVRLETAATVRDLLNERAQIQRYADVRAFTSQAPSRLELLASDRDPAVSVAFSEKDYYDVAGVLEHFYSICITDCGTGLLHSAMAGVLQLADQIVLVSSPSVDGARSASATLDWLDAHDYSDLVRNAVVVLSIIRPRSKSTVDIDRLEQHFAARCRAVARIPYDSHLEEGAEVDLELLNPETADAYLVLAATVGDGFAWPRRVRTAAS